MSEPVAVTVPRGTVYLAPRLTVPMGAAAMAVLNGIDPTIGAMQAALTAVYLSPAPAGGILSWTLVDELLQPIPLTSEAIEQLLPWTEGGAEVAEMADTLYAGDLFRPLAQRRQTSSPRGRTGDSTSVKPASGSKPPKPSKPSSQNGTAGLASAAPAR